MIHGGLNIELKTQQGGLTFNQCCLSTTQLTVPQDVKNLWQNEKLKLNRQINENKIYLYR